MFVTGDDLAAFAPGSLIVDVSCDDGMGFSWARPTSFADPMFMVGDGVHYYAVDHSPSLLWNSATWEISEALLPYLQHGARRARGLGLRAGHPREPSRSTMASIQQPRHPVLPAARAGVSVPAAALTTAAHSSLLWAHSQHILDV